MASKVNERSLKNNQPLLPAAQQELDGKVHQCTRLAYHAEAYGVMELIARGMKMQAIREVVESSEMLKIKGFNSFEDFFESLGISPRTGFNLKKIAEAFSTGELQLLQSMRFSQRNILRLAYLPSDQLPDLTDDPVELKAQLEDAIAAIAKQRKDNDTATKKMRDLEGTVKDLKACMPKQDNLDWAWGALDRISASLSAIHKDMSYILDDHRFVGNAELKSKVSGLYDQANKTLIELFSKIEKNTGYYPERKSDDTKRDDAE
jgi:hypothetical protein